MHFTYKVISSRYNLPSEDRNTAYLSDDNWDDFSFKTLFHLDVFDVEGTHYEIGALKIGFIGQAPSSRTSLEPNMFASLNESMFSLGQDPEYYQNLTKLPTDLRNKILTDLRDLVADEALWERVENERVVRTSLLRSVSRSSVTGQFRRLLGGGALRSPYHFRYVTPPTAKVAPIAMEFHVDPESNPPTNIHVLIGRNGVGKTYILNGMVKALTGNTQTGASTPYFEGLPDAQNNPPERDLFAGVVSVAFSAFDPFDPEPEQKELEGSIRYSYVGLKRTTNRGGEKGTPMSHDMLVSTFSRSLANCNALGRRQRWEETVEKLASDPMFGEQALEPLLTAGTKEQLEERAEKIFKRLSSGHGIVLLTLTKLVELTEEKTLVLLDEPEGHLHPPLLSAFVRALSDLLDHRNGVAIIATHSPVIVQEVPRSCVWKVRRTGLTAYAERPEAETFGENVGTLTREVFGLEVTDAGFHQLLKKVISEGYDYEGALDMFSHQLGAEGRAILRGLALSRRQQDEVDL